MSLSPTDPALSRVESTVVESILPGQGEMAVLCRAVDWPATPLGPLSSWSRSLRTTVSTVLSSRHPMFLWWGSELIQFYNDGYRPSLGQGGRHPRALAARGRDFWTEIWEIIGPQIDVVMNLGESTWHEDQLVAIERNGRIEEVYWTYSYSPVRDDDGSIGGTLVVCQETTSRVVAERRLRILHRLAALQPQGSPDEAAREATRVLAEDTLDVPFVLCYLFPEGRLDEPLRLVHSEGLAQTMRPESWPLHEAIRTRAASFVDLRGWPEIEGTGPWPESPVSAVVLPIVAAADDGEAAGALVVGLSPRLPWEDDYSEFLSGAANHVASQVSARRLHEERERRDRELEIERSRLEVARNRAKSQFLANMSHEIRTPINAIVGYADLLESGLRGALNDGQRSYVNRVKTSAGHLTGLVDEILDLAKIEAGGMHLQPDRFRIFDTLVAALSMIEPQAHRKGIAVPDRPDCDRSIIYVGDEDRVRQIVVNLLSNAVKFTPAGGRVVVRCSQSAAPLPSLEARGAGPWLAIDVEDTGIGIDAEHLSGIFEPFVQVDGSHTRREGGTGLGLTISRKLAHLMHGDVTVRSQPGKGSCFTLWLPIPAAASR
jgi:signal transduction histidine kinase